MTLAVCCFIAHAAARPAPRSFLDELLGRDAGQRHLAIVWCHVCGVQPLECSGLSGCARDVKPEEEPLAEKVETEEPALGVTGLLGDLAGGLQCGQLFVSFGAAERLAKGLAVQATEYARCSRKCGAEQPDPEFSTCSMHLRFRMTASCMQLAASGHTQTLCPAPAAQFEVAWL